MIVGSKSPFALVSTFSLNSYIDGIKHTCIWFKDEEDIPVLNIISSTPTEEPNGLEYIITLPVIHHEAINLAISYIPEFLPVKALICDDYESKKGRINDSYILEETDDYFIVRNKSTLINTMNNNKHHYYSNTNYNHVISIGGVLYNYSNYIDTGHALATSNLVYKVPIGKLDLPDTREQLQNTAFNKDYLGKYIKENIDKFVSLKVQELKLLSIELENAEFTDCILAYNEYAKKNGYTLRALYQHIDANDLLVVPEEYRFLNSTVGNNKSYYRSITINVNATVINKNNGKFVSTTSKSCIDLSTLSESTLIIIDDLKKLPVSHMVCLDQKYDSYLRINTMHNSNIDFSKYLEFFNTFILPFTSDCVVINASELFTQELADKYKATKTPVVRTASTTSTKSNKSLAGYRYLTLTGNKRTTDFMYTALSQFEHNGSDVFDASYASLFKGVIIPALNSSDINVPALNSFTNLASTYNIPATYVRCNKSGIGLETMLEEVSKAFSGRDDVFIYDPSKWEQGIAVLNFLQEDLVNTSVIRELASLYYIQTASDYRTSYGIVNNIIAGNVEHYPLASSTMLTMEEEWNAANLIPERVYSGATLYHILQRIIKDLSIHPTVLNILQPSFTRTGFIHCTEERLNNLINDYIKTSSHTFFHLRINSVDNNIGKCISDKFTNTEESIND